jgi:hypothetical protein
MSVRTGSSTGRRWGSGRLECAVGSRNGPASASRTELAIFNADPHAPATGKECGEAQTAPLSCEHSGRSAMTPVIVSRPHCGGSVI